MNKYRLEVQGKVIAEWEGHKLHAQLPKDARGYGLCDTDYRDADSLGRVRWVEPGLGVEACLTRVEVE